MPIVESDWHQLSTVQGPTSPRGATLAAANVIAPTTFLTILTGNVANQDYYSASSVWTYAGDSICGSRWCRCYG